MDLIYHLPNKLIERSPFDIAIESVVKNKIIKIACPYIGISYFKSAIISQSKDFFLITDVNALITSCENIKEINKILTFIIDNQKKIRHISGLHSKIIISKDNAFVGSSNLTTAGITRNNELSIIINESEKIKELNQWFDIWWNNSLEINIKDLKTKITEFTKSKTSISPIPEFIKNNNTIRSQYENHEKNGSVDFEIDRDYLINFLRYWKNKEWLISYCNLAKHILTKFKLKDDDIRLCINCRSDKHRLPITIGQRYIMQPHEDGEFTVSLIMPITYDIKNAKLDGRTKTTYYQKGSKNDVPWVHYDKPEPSFTFNKETITQWEIAVENELKRTKKSGFKKFHQPEIYKLFMDEDYRNQIIQEVFGKE